MRKIKFRTYSDCLKSQDHASLRRFEHPQFICTLVVALFFLIGFKYRFAFVMALTLVFILLLNYYYLRHIAQKFLLKADPVNAGSEKESARLNLSISNLSMFAASNFILTFEFSGSTNLYYSRAIENEIESGSLFRAGYDLFCDNGMGLFEAKNFKILISDMFDVLQFEISFDETVPVEVRPKLEDLPTVKTRGSKYSELYGNHEIQSRGLSVNFSSLRPYAFGDSVRHIAWRPSARHGSLIVKEFERMVNTDATFIVNLNPTHHIGLADMNTWEATKDICLSLVSQMLAAGNSVEFIYNYGFIEKSNSKDQFYAISKVLMEHDIFSAAEGNHKNKVHIDDPLGNWAQRISPGSTLFYIAPVNYPHLRDSAQSLKWLSRENVEVILILVNPLTIWPEFREADSSLEAPDKTDKINLILADLQSANTRVFFADLGGALPDHFREKPRMSEKLTPPRFTKRPDAAKRAR